MQPTISQSRYLDGAIPGMRNPRVFESVGRMYIQPDIHVTDMGEGSVVDDGNTGICQRIDEDLNFGISDWLRTNRSAILTGLAIYGGYRLLRGKG